MIAKKHSVREETIREWHRKGWIPGVSHGKQTRFDEDAVAHALEARQRRSEHGKLCSVCGRDLPLDAFNPVKDKRKGHEGEKVPASDCRECRKARKREARRDKARKAGKVYRTRQEMAAQREAAKERKLIAAHSRETERMARQTARQETLRAEGREGMSLTLDEHRASVRRERMRYQSDPAFRSNKLARKERYRRLRGQRPRTAMLAEVRERWVKLIGVDFGTGPRARRKRRERQIRLTMTRTISLQAIAVRDGWKCAICGGRVTRRDWSMDHIIALSEGGTHTYDNVTLAHWLCNSTRGVAGKPVQVPLFADPGDIGGTCRFFPVTGQCG